MNGLDIKFKFSGLLEKVNGSAPYRPDIAIILGSGLGDFPNELTPDLILDVKELPGYPPSTVAGHGGKIYFGRIENRKVLAFQGRIHFYEGYTIDECLIPVLITKSLGIDKIIITNAAGGVNPDFNAGDLMLGNSFNSINIKDEMQRILPVAAPEQYSALQNFGSTYLFGLIKQAAEIEDFKLQEGVYWYNKGPSYETPAEVKMSGICGADAVGMSSVHEVLYAVSEGLDTVMISLISNLAAGISATPLSHQEVMETAALVKVKFNQLIKRTISLL